MEPSERKLLFVFVREVLVHPGDDGIDITRRNQKTVQALRSLGFIAANEDSLTTQAYLAYFGTFEEIECPPEVQQWVDRFGIPDLHWRKPSGIIKDRMPQELGKAYPPLATVFIGRLAGSSTWFHELGHVIYARIDADLKAKLVAAAKANFPVISSDQVTDAADPVTKKPIALPEGKYLNINRRYCGVDHSGPDADAESDEIWAILFSEYCGGFEFPSSVRVILEEIIIHLTTPRG
jgi:hypothetical protein